MKRLHQISIMTLVVIVMITSCLNLIIAFTIIPKLDLPIGFASSAGKVNLCMYKAPELSLSTQTAYVNSPFSFQLPYTNYVNNTLTFSDNTSLFDVNSSDGSINFTPSALNEGSHSILITITESGNCALDGTSAVFNLNIQVSGGGTGGGANTKQRIKEKQEPKPIIMEFFYLDRTTSTVTMYNDETKIITVKVISNMDKDIFIDIFNDDENEIIDDISSKIKLPKHGESIFNLRINPNAQHLAGTYIEKIHFAYGNYSLHFYPIINLKKRNLLFDYDLKIPEEYKLSNPGDDVVANTTITKIDEFRQAKVNILFQVMNFDGQIFDNRNETVILTDTTSQDFLFPTDSDMPYDDYVIYSIASIGNISVYSSDSFKLGNATIPTRIMYFEKLNNLWLYILIPIIVFLITMSIIFISKKHYYQKLSFDLSHSGSSYKEIAIYIKKEIERGFEIPDIKKALLGVGHSKHIIDEAIREVNEKYYKR